MLRPTPRLIWSSACVACLGAVAAALFWPTQDIPRLRPVIDPQTSGFASPSAGLTAAATAAVSRTELTDAIEGHSADEASDDDQKRSDPADEAVRDAVADGARRAAPAGGDSTQAPWHAYWGVTKRQTAAVPVPQTLPTTYRRASRDGGAPAATPGVGGKAFQSERAAIPRGPAGRLFRTGVGAGEAFSPEKTSRRMADLLRLIRADRASPAEATGTPRASSRQPEQKMHPALGRAAPATPKGRAARIEAVPRTKAAHKAKAEPKAKVLKPPRLRPVLLSKVLGLNAIRPPKAGIKVPDFSRLARAVPKTGPDGRPMDWAATDVKTVESLRPPAEAAADCRRPGRHWHPGPEPIYHDGQAWGLPHGEGWLWFKRSGKNWWAWTSPQEPTWLWHAEHWWWRSDGVWFMLNQGEVWGYRLFGERRAEGLIHPGTGTQMEYSADGKRVAMITPGDGAWLFDARSGAVLERWTEAQMPARPKPHAPRALSLP